MAKARKWTTAKTFRVTMLCGIGHVLSSVIIGIIGISLSKGLLSEGIASAMIELIESTRGEIAAWLLTGFGLLYLIWGLKKAINNKPHSHLHSHADGTLHKHTHTHNLQHKHIHELKGKSITPWALFIIFAFGPCEPLIPLLMYPAANLNFTLVILVAFVFGIVTIITMLAVVFISSYAISGYSRILSERTVGPNLANKLGKYSHAIAGFAVFISGLAVNFLGL